MLEFYRGDYNDLGMRHGFGKMTFPNGYDYEGEWSNDKWNGKGKCKWPNGDSYDGEFINGRISGQGKFKFANGSSLQGFFLNGMLNGYGCMVTNEYTYVGYFKDGRSHGEGNSYDKNGTYSGEWKDGQKYGRGHFIRNDGVVYSGEWENNLKEGNGIEINKYGLAYLGPFKNDVYSGKDGRVSYFCCTIASGEFRNGWVDTDAGVLIGFVNETFLYVVPRFVCCCYSSTVTQQLLKCTYPKFYRIQSLARAKDLKIHPFRLESPTSEIHDTVTTLQPQPSLPSIIPHDPNALPPIRLINFELFQGKKTFPRFPDDANITVELDSVDRSESLIIFISHCWLAGYEGSSEWRGYPHVDDRSNTKFKICMSAIENAWKIFAPGMKKCFIWLDYGCINQDGDPAGELKQLSKIVESSHCILTPIIDPEYLSWSDHQHFNKDDEGWLTKYKAKLWMEGPFAYLNRAWCRMEMLYAANIPLAEGDQNNIDKFQAGLRSAILAKRRAHLLYGSRELALQLPPLVLEPLQNSYFEQYDPLKGSITKVKDFEKIKELMNELTIIRATESYDGKLDSDGRRVGYGKFITLAGDVYEGNWKDGMRSGKGRQIYSNGDVYEGEWTEDDHHGYGRYDFADGRKYEGDFQKSIWQGKGKYIMLNEIYEGDFDNMEMSGLGERTYKDGSKYVGSFVEGKRHGTGRCMWPYGGYYEGEWSNDERCGNGLMLWRKEIPDFPVKIKSASPRAYKGLWLNNKPTGTGIMIYNWGMKDAGNFLDGSLNGKGSRSYTYCPLVITNFSDGQPNSALGYLSIIYTTLLYMPCIVCMSSCSFEKLYNMSYNYNAKFLPEIELLSTPPEKLIMER
jgi:hypothetical protein